MAFDYDAFLSYNRDDAAIVEAIALRLRQEAKLHVFLDRWCLIPGEPWQEEIESALDRSATCIVFIGPNGRSSWVHVEMRAALELRASKRMLRVIPLLLPGASKELIQGLPLFLKSLTWVDYTAGLNDEKAFEALQAGISRYTLGPSEILLKVEPGVERNLGTMIVDSLLPVANFQDRPELNALRSFWADEERAGVMALVGIGGSGKTALVCRFLQELPNSGLDNRYVSKNKSLPLPEGTFVWSLYDNPNIELFMQALHEYLTGQELVTAPARDLTYRVIRHMERSKLRRVLIVLDGVEVVQEGQASEGGFGLLRDTSLRHLVRRIAQGGLGFRLILTSRFPLPDMEAFEGTSYWSLETDDLDPISARSLLRAHGVTGTDGDLDTLVQDYGRHALTLDHLGTLLREFFDSNPQRAQELPSLGTTQSDAYADYQARRLARIFMFYEQHISSTELLVLKTLCVFLMPIAVITLIKIFTNDTKDVAVSIPRLTEFEVKSALAQLHSRKLLMFHESGDEKTCSVHPTIQGYFYRAIGQEQANFHAVIREHLIPLAERPNREIPIDSFSLDVLEELIYHTIRSGDLDKALQFYGIFVGGYTHLGWHLSDYQRGLRITSLFVEAGGIDLEADIYSTRPWYDRSLFNLDLGHLSLAELQMRKLLESFKAQSKKQANEIRQKAIEMRQKSEQGTTIGYSELKTIRNRSWKNNAIMFIHLYARSPDLEKADVFIEGLISRLAEDNWFYHESILLQSICDVLVVQGNLSEAESIADLVISESGEEFWLKHRAIMPETGSNPFGRRAIARYLSGKVQEALSDFYMANEISNRQFEHYPHRERYGGYHIAMQMVFLSRLGKLRAARDLVRNCNLESIRRFRPLLAVQYELALAEIYLISSENNRAIKYLDSALAWSMHSGHQETYVRANLGHARSLLKNNSPDEARAVLREAEQVARMCGFKIWLADILVIAAHLAFHVGELDQAIGYATEAFQKSADEQCSYRWGMGNAAHSLAEIEVKRGNIAIAIKHANDALTFRKSIQDPKIRNTQLLLQRIIEEHPSILKPPMP